MTTVFFSDTLIAQLPRNGAAMHGYHTFLMCALSQEHDGDRYGVCRTQVLISLKAKWKLTIGRTLMKISYICVQMVTQQLMLAVGLCLGIPHVFVIYQPRSAVRN